MATKKYPTWWDKAHYHCFGCQNLFPKSRARLHYGLHRIHTCTSDTSTPVQTQQTLQQTLPEPLPTQSPLHMPTQNDDEFDGNPEENASSFDITLQQEVTAPLMMTMHNFGPSSAPFTRLGSSTDRLPCPHCSREFHPHSLKSHIDSQHRNGSLGHQGNNITATSYHFGVCVDEGAGVFLVRRNRRGVSYCAHVQYCPNGNPPVMACQVKACQQVMDTAARSGLLGYVCKHLQSVPFLPKSVPWQVLGSGSLDHLINVLQLLRPSRKDECLKYQAAALRAGVSMIVQLKGESYASSRYLNFSVWDGGERKKWWSFYGRVCVTYDCEQHIWFCKHVKGSQSCIHKTIVKWYMAETKQFPDHLMSSLPREVDSDECNSDDADHETMEPDIDGIEEEPLQISRHFPPQEGMAKEMARYIFSNKKIPVALPVSLTSGATSFPKR